jgi:hypothetical protein
VEPFSDEGRMIQESIKRRADRIVNENITTFKHNVAATIEYELIMMKRETKDGNIAAAQHHKLMAEIYQSILNRI